MRLVVGSLEGSRSLPRLAESGTFILKLSWTRGQTTEARRTTVLQPVEGKPQSQEDRQKEKEEDFVPDEGTR